jgi:CelD/BcsL family acetyltransferase involved in cellulose biosynthesis
MTAIETRSEASDIVVAVDGLPSAPEMEPLWRDLESRAAASFFLSWTWIGTWLAVTELEPEVIAARLGGRLVGLGLLNPIRRGRLGLRWPALSLNEVGRAGQDCIMIEDNGFLAERGAEASVTAACLGHLTALAPEWRELRLSGVPAAMLEGAASLGLTLRIEARRPSYLVDVGTAFADGQLTSLSANARQQINRSLRLYRERGELTLRRSATIDEALERFAEMETLHQQRWMTKGKPGAFGVPFFRRFHRALLARGFPAGEVDVLRVAAGSKTIGLLYTFFHRGEAYAYQNGFAFESDARLKPGLVSHRLAIEYCRDIGLRRYRLLAGESRYKRTLATESYELYWLSLRRPDLAFRLERIARHIAGREP